MRKISYLTTLIAACQAGVMLIAAGPVLGAPLLAPLAVIHIAGGKHGIGFDDIGYFPALDKVSIPAGQTGKLVLLDPATGRVWASYKVTPSAAGTHGHEEGTTSAAYGDGYIFASDHGQPGVVVLAARTGKVLEHVKLDSGPDYVRYFGEQRELWVTEPRAQQIQVFSFKPGPKPLITPKSVIHISGGPESLVFDTALHRAYTNHWKDETVVIDTLTHKTVAVWKNSCRGPRGLALDQAKGFLFVACTEGKVAVLDLNHNGKLLATAPSGAGIDIISYNPHSQHLYVPGARSATLTLFKVSPSGMLHPLARYRTAKGSHCVTDDGQGRAFVCDPHAGSILEIKSP